MQFFNNLQNRQKRSLLATLTIGTLAFGLMACSSDDDDDSGTGYLQFYNASVNSPAIYPTVTDDDENEDILTGVEFADASAYYEYNIDDYALSLSWQDDEDSLNSFYDGTLSITDEHFTLVVLADELSAANVYQYQIPIEDPDSEDEVFNLRFINMNNFDGGVDIYQSKSDETFNEAQMIVSQTKGEISDGVEYELDNYVFYLTAAGSDEVLYQSESIAFAYTSQYVFVVRENTGAGSSPFTLDKLLNSSTVTSYADEDAEAEIRVYNAIAVNAEGFANYSGSFNLHIDAVSEQPLVSDLAQGQFSDTQPLDFGDYAVTLTTPDNSTVLSNNHLLTLGSNTDKTAFFYLFEEITEDSDGNEESEFYVNSLVVENSNRNSLYDHYVTAINLVDDYSLVDFYFVRSNETIDNATYSLQNRYVTPLSISLLNNTYTIYAVATDNNSERILASEVLTLDENIADLFMILEEDESSASGYKMTFNAQND